MDYLLSLDKARLVDFLHSPINTNHEGSLANKQLFDGLRRATVTLRPEDIKKIMNGPGQEHGSKTAAEALKLEMVYDDAPRHKGHDRPSHAQRARRRRTKPKHGIRGYTIIKVLGEGAFAKVMLVRNKGNGRLYAMKVIHKDKIMMQAGNELDCNGERLSTEELAYRNMYRVK